MRYIAHVATVRLSWRSRHAHTVAFENHFRSNSGVEDGEELVSQPSMEDNDDLLKSPSQKKYQTLQAGSEADKRRGKGAGGGPTSRHTRSGVYHPPKSARPFPRTVAGKVSAPRAMSWSESHDLLPVPFARNRLVEVGCKV
jgi:hypothetical protein